MTIYYWIESLFCLSYCGKYIEEGVLGRHMACAERKEVRAGFWWTNLKQTDHLQELGLEGGIIINGL